MDLSPHVQGSHATPSPSGTFIAYVTNGRFRIGAAHAPARYVEFHIPIAGKDVTGLKWDEGNTRVAVASSQTIEVVDLDDPKHRVRIDNGSGGLGRFASADFVGLDQLLVLWEYGRAKLWNLATGQVVELGDVKTTGTGRNWQRRPDGGNTTLRALATLSRPGAEDLLSLHFPELNKSISSVKLPSADARSLSWSPDGRWLAVVDSPTHGSSAYFYTPDGHYYRSYPPARDSEPSGLGVKSLVWSRNSQIVALTRYDGRVVLLNCRTFTALAVIEHTTTIDQSLVPPNQQAPIWQEFVSASGERGYNLQPQPFSPPLSRTKPSTEPHEHGVAEAVFSGNGNYLATRDEQTLSTIWIWNLASMSAHTIAIQHSNVRRMLWHPSRGDTLMIDCGEGIAYLLEAASHSPPQPLNLEVPLPATLSWLLTGADAQPIIMAANRSAFRLCYPEGSPRGEDRARDFNEDDTLLSGASDDSLFDVLSGRKPLPPKTEPSYTERVDLEVETDEAGSSVQLDDTFVGKRMKFSRQAEFVDPLDDSQIF